MSKFDEMCEMKEILIKWAKSEIERGPENVNTEEMGQVIDMIKDNIKLIKYQMQNVYKYDYKYNYVLANTMN